MSGNEEYEIIRHRVSMWGYVRTAAQARVSGARVEAAHASGGVRRSTETRRDGLFVISDLTPGEYTVTAEKGRLHATAGTRVEDPKKQKRRLGPAVQLTMRSG